MAFIHINGVEIGKNCRFKFKICQIMLDNQAFTGNNQACINIPCCLLI